MFATSSYLLAQHQAVGAGAADQGAYRARTLAGSGREHGRDRGRTAELDREVQLVPEPASGLAHVVVRDQHDLVDQALDDVEGDRRAEAWCERASDSSDRGQLDQATGADALVEGGRADRFHPDDAHR